MSKTFYKLPGEKLTPEEAAEAQTAFESNALPSRYEFKHWSHSPTSDDEVTALNPGGAGVSVVQNKTYYPVIGLQSIVKITKSGTTLRYEYTGATFTVAQDANFGLIVHGTNGYYSGGTLNIMFIQTDIENSGSGTVTYNANAGNVDFGVITLPGNSAANPHYVKAYAMTSEIDGAEYTLKLEANYYSSLSQTMIVGTLYKIINGVLTKILDLSITPITTKCLMRTVTVQS